MADERFVSMIEMGLASAQFSDAEGIDALGILLEIGRFVEGGAIALPDFDPDAVTGVLRLREGYLDSWAGVLGHLGESFEPMEIAGLDAHVIGAGTGDVLALVDVGGLTVLAAGDEEAAMASARAQVAALEDGPGEPGWWSEVPERADGAVVEAFIGFGALATQSAELAMMDGIVQGLYVGMGMGEGAAGEMLFGAALYENDVAEAFAAAMKPADLSLARRVPSDANVVTVGNFDMLAFLDACAALVDSIDVNAEAGVSIDQAMEVGSEFLGLDIEEDLIGNLTGHMVMAQWLGSFDQLMAIEEDEDPAEIAKAFPLIALGISDEEPYLELMDIGIGFLGGVEHEVVDSDLGTELIVSPPDVEGVTVHVLVTSDWVGLSMDQARLHGFVRGDTEDGWLTPAEASKVESQLPAPGYSFMRAPWLADIMLGAMAAGGEMGGVPPEVYDALEALGEHVDAKVASGTILTERWISASFQTF